MDTLQLPKEIHSVPSILAEPTMVPTTAGYNFWFFKGGPNILPLDNCTFKQDLPALFIGTAQGKSGLRKRICQEHINGSARNSTLRMSLGVILSEESCYPLRLHKNEKDRYWLSTEGEDWLSSWMSENAFVGFVECSNPKAHEKELIQRFKPPLNIIHNNNQFSKKLKSMRRSQQKAARQSPPAF